MKNRIYCVVEKRLFWTLFITVVLTGVAAILGKSVELRYDAAWYFKIADPVFSNGFHILKFPETFRGYVFPVALGILKYICIKMGIDGIWAWRMMVSFMISVLFIWVFPFIFRQCRGKQSACQTVRILLSTIIMLYFMGMYLVYPLSDIPASFFMFSAIAIVIALGDDGSQKISVAGVVQGIGAGVFIYAAYNTRAVFLFGGALLVLFYIIRNIWKRNWKNFLYLIGMFAGMLLIAMPQMLINHQYIGVYSPKVYTEQAYGYQHDLQSQQVLWGLTMPRYETYTGDQDEYPNPGVVFNDPVGKEIEQREKLQIETFSITAIFKLFLKYPVDMLGIYGRHLINAVTPVFPQMYITNMYSNKGWYICLAILLWLGCGVGVIFGEQTQKYNIWTGLYLLAAVIPPVLQMTGALEWRFFMPVHLLLYYYVCNEIDVKSVMVRLKHQWLRVLAVCVVIFMLWISCIGLILGDNAEKTLLINDYNYHTLSEEE